LESFENDEAGYARLGKPYKFYMMFHGLHGCAKTSVIKAIAKKTGKHVILMRLECFKDVIELCNSISNFAKNHRLDYKKCMFVIEEFDCFEQISRDNEKGDATTVVIVGDEEKTTKSSKKVAEHEIKKANEAKAKIALGKMLNTFDGIKEHGCTAIFTTNKPEVFDPALVRPGRIELMKFGKLGAKEISEYWNLSYNDDIPESLATRMSGRQDLISLADLSLILENDKCEARMKIGDLIEKKLF
jgi:chaperone BCS1